MAERNTVRLLIIDDSALNRRTIAGFFSSHPEVEIVGMAADGQEGLQLALTKNPTVITVDLEMPRLDGFGFLRLLMSNHPSPVIVISSHAAKDTVFRAMELGALDFVAKPMDRISPDLSDIREDVIRKVLTASQYNQNGLKNLCSSAPQTGLHYISHLDPTRVAEPAAKPYAKKIVVIGASTGGPASLTRVLRSLPANLEAGIVIAQHMPPRFTTTFAERLDKLCPMTVCEMNTREMIRKGHVYLAPGDGDLEVSRSQSGYLVGRVPHDEATRYTPSVNRLFISAGKAVGADLLAIVLTGMGDDGALGASIVHANGGRILVESEETAVIFGMPRSTIETGVPVQIRPLNMIADRIAMFCR